VLSIVFSLFWIGGVKAAMEFGVQLFSIATAGMLGLFALGALTKRANAKGAFVGIVACALFTAWATLTSVKLPVLDRVVLDLGPLNYRLHPVLIGVFNHIVVFVVGLGASLWLARHAAVPPAVAQAPVES
jgi:SSS family solute:Na+ symporter